MRVPAFLAACALLALGLAVPGGAGAQARRGRRGHGRDTSAQDAGAPAADAGQSAGAEGESPDDGASDGGSDNAAPEDTSGGSDESTGEAEGDDEVGEEPDALPEGPVVAVHIEPELPGEDPWARAGISPGTAFNRAVGRAALQHALASRTFAEARATAESVPGGVALYIRGERRVMVREVALSGVSDRPLDSVRADFGIQHDTWVTDADVARAADHLRQTYVDAGWSSARVTTRWRNTDDPATRVLLVNIVEGPVTRVRNVLLEGVPADVEGDVRSALGIGEGSVADPRALRRSTEQVSSEMRRARYLAAVVRPVRFVTAADNLVDAVVSMDPGPHFRLEWVGVSRVSTGALADALHLEEEHGLEVTALNAMVMRLRDYYVRRAFLDARVRADVRTEGPGRAVLRFTVTQGQQVFVSNVLFPGAEHLGADALRTVLEDLLTNDLPGGADTILQDPGEAVEDAIDGGPGFSAAGTRRRAELHPEHTYVPELYGEAIHRMVARYREIGFLDASIADPQIRRVQDVNRRPALEVTFRVTEGPRTMLEEVVFEGNTSVPSQTLAEQTGLSLGVPISYAALDSARTHLVEYYRERGRMFVRVVPNPDRSPNRERARLRFTIDEGPEVRVGRILVQGNERTPTWVIAGRMALRPGDIMRPSALRASQRQLGELGFFSGVTITPVDPDAAAPVKDLIVQVQELRAQYTEIRGGVSTGEGVRAALEYGARNVAGTGVNFSFSGQLGYLFQLLDNSLYRNAADLFRWRALASLLYPIAPLSGPYLRGSFDIATNRVIERQFSIDSASVGSSVTFRPSRVLSFAATQEVQFSSLNLPAGETIAQLIAQAVESGNTVEANRLRRALLLPQGRTLLTASRVTGSIDLRDQIFNPTRGVFITASAEYVHIVDFASTLPADPANPNPQDQHPGDVLHLFGSVSGYVPVPVGGIVLASIFRAGVNVHLDSYTQTYPSRLFFMGGSDSMRGWSQDTMIPADQFGPAETAFAACQANNLSNTGQAPVPCAELAQRGGDVFINWRNEARIPLTTLQGIGVGLALFADVGNLWAQTSNFFSTGQGDTKFPLLRVSVGVGLRAILPIGPVALDVGFNTDPIQVPVTTTTIDPVTGRPVTSTTNYPLESLFAVHFSIGVF